jgi:transcriptional regulator with XRE-family HTH domain
LTTILRKMRKERGLTIPYMAKRLGIPEGYYSEIETGKKTVSDERAQAIADVLNVDKNEIFLPSRFALREVGTDSA